MGSKVMKMLTTDKQVLQSYTASKCLWLGVPGIEVTKRGRVFLSFCSGGKTEEIGNVVLLIRSEDGINFGDPIAVCVEEQHRCFDSCLWIDPLGRLWLIWARYPDDGVYAAICEDPDAEEPVFGEEFKIGNSIMINKPTVLSTGEWAFPLAVWRKGVQALPGSPDTGILPKGSFLYMTSDQGKSFRPLGYADVKDRTFDEHMFLELNNGVLRVFVRTSYGIGAADSYDGGFHWGEGFDTGYNGPCSRFFIRRMPSGRILLINHYKFTGRNNLTAMLSEDEGRTFPYRLMLDERNNVAYPDASIDETGRIYLVYDRERGAYEQRFDDILKNARELLTASICEEDILQGKLVTNGSFLKRVAYKLTDYDGPLQNPFHEPSRYSASEYAAYLDSINNTKGIISDLFDEYRINCINIHNVQAKRLDRLIEAYHTDNDVNTLNEIIELVRSVGDECSCSEKTIVDQICSYVSCHPDQDLDIEQIAEQFHFSVYHIRHIFKRQTGMNLTEFKTAQRIRKAKLLLRGCDNKIAEISACCGYDNSSYFTEVFTKFVGCSPSDYRRRYQ